jgi:hypothetical protein
MSLTVSSLNERLRRWEDFMNGNRKPFLFHVNFASPEWDAQLPPDPPLWPEHAQARIERCWAEYELMRKKAGLVDDDRVPYLSNITGTEIFAEAFGCQVFRVVDNMPFALPLVISAAEADALNTPELSASSLAYLFDIADELHRRGGAEAVMKPVDIQSPMDITALIWEKSSLYLAMLETPEAVKALSVKVSALLTAFFDEWFRRYGTTFVAHYPDYVMHGGITMSVDEVGAINQAMFRQYFRDELVTLSEHFRGLGIHCCADARHQWGEFRSLPGLRLINHNNPPTRDPGEYIPDSLRFYGAQVAQMPVGWMPDGPAESWPAQFPEGSRVVFEVEAEDVEQAMAIAERLQVVRERIASGEEK